MDINSYIWKGGILFGHAADKANALTQIIARASEHPSVTNPKALADGIYTRERIISTGIGLGVAIPHAKIGGISEFFICISVLDEGIDWDAIDNEPVRIIFMIAGPETKQNLYLQLLASLSLTVKNPTKRLAMLSAESPEQLIGLLS